MLLWHGGSPVRALRKSSQAYPQRRTLAGSIRVGTKARAAMPWDFCTEPEFEAQAGLDARLRARGDLAAGDAARRARLGRAARAARRRSRSRSRRRACGPRTSTPSSAARASARSSSGSCTRSSAPPRSRRWPSATRRPTRATRRSSRWPGTPEQKERYLHPLLAGDLKSAFSMTEPDTAGSDPTLLPPAAERDGDRLGDQRPQVVLLQRLDRRLPDRDGGHRPRGPAPPARLDVHRRCRHPGRQHRARRRHDGASRARPSAATATTPRSSTRTCASRPSTARGRRAPAS